MRNFFWQYLSRAIVPMECAISHCVSVIRVAKDVAKIIFSPKLKAFLNPNKYIINILILANKLTESYLIQLIIFILNLVFSTILISIIITKIEVQNIDITDIII